MTRIQTIEGASRSFLEGFVKSISRMIDAGKIQDEHGNELRPMLEQAFRLIPSAPDNFSTNKNRR